MTDSIGVLDPGTRVREFVVVRELGVGGFGVTYLARDTRLGRQVALKEYFPRHCATRRGDGSVGPWSSARALDYAWGLKRFLGEAEVLARFDHAHIVGVHQVFEERGTAYLVMAFVEGHSLAAELKEAGRLPEERVRSLLTGLAAGLEHMHTEQVDGAVLLHRDITPKNVMLRQDGRPVLIDFGSARYAAGEHSQALTSVLTPGYAPFEQYHETGRQGPWTDVYGLSAVAYRSLTGRTPPAATARMEADTLVPVERVAEQRVSLELASAVMAGLAVDWAERPTSVAAWQAMWEGPVPPPREPPRMGLRGLVVAGLAVALLVLAWIVQRDWSVSDGNGGDDQNVIDQPLAKMNGKPVAVPGGVGGKEAREGWEEIQETESTEVLEGYVNEYGGQPGTAEWVQQARSLLGELRQRAVRLETARGALQEARGTGTVAALEAYMVRFEREPGAANLVREAREQLAELRMRGRAREGWEEIQETESTEVLEGYVNEYGGQPGTAEWVQQARSLLEELRQRAVRLETARGALQEARGTGTVAALEAYIARYEGQPGAANLVMEARKSLDKAERQERLHRLKPEMVVIPGGSFRMGCMGDLGCDDDEEPAHVVRVETFELSKHEVTFEKYDRFTAATGHRQAEHAGWGRGRRPVIDVSWGDAVAYARWLSAETGGRYPPTERGGMGVRGAGGDNDGIPLRQ